MTIFIEFLDIPIIDKHCGSVYTTDGSWIKCNLCEKVIMCRTGRPFNMVLWREHKSESTNHLTKLNLEKEKQRMGARIILNGDEVLPALQRKQLEQIRKSHTKCHIFSTQPKFKRKADNHSPRKSTASTSATFIEKNLVLTRDHHIMKTTNAKVYFPNTREMMI